MKGHKQGSFFQLGFARMIQALISIVILAKSSFSTRLMMVVEGGPFDCLQIGYGKNMVLYGDQWDRGYKYNALTNKDKNKFEGGHSDQYIEGIAEHKRTKSIITVGTDGSLVVWNQKSNKSILRVPNIGGKNVTLTDMIITPNDLIIVSVFKPN